MSDHQATGDLPQGNLDQAQQPQLVINGQYTKDLSFEVPNAPLIYTKMSAPPDVKLDIDVTSTKIGDAVYEVVLHLHAEAKIPDMVAFVAEVKYAAVVTVSLPEEHIKPATLIEVPRVIFPFARNILSDVTRDGGFPPLLVQPPDFGTLYQRTQLADRPSAGNA